MNVLGGNVVSAMMKWRKKRKLYNVISRGNKYALEEGQKYVSEILETLSKYGMLLIQLKKAMQYF